MGVRSCTFSSHWTWTGVWGRSRCFSRNSA